MPARNKTHMQCVLYDKHMQAGALNITYGTGQWETPMPRVRSNLNIDYSVNRGGAFHPTLGARALCVGDYCAKGNGGRVLFHVFYTKFFLCSIYFIVIS